MRNVLSARTLLSIMALLVMLAGCASTQEADERQGFTFFQVKAMPDSFQGQPAVFGGKVLTARRQKDGTRIEILQLPLDRSMRPVYDLTQSQGRFIAIYREFLDPATIPPGTRVTVTGQVSSSITLPLDETDYTYPVLNINRVQVWDISEDMALRMRPYMGPGRLLGTLLGSSLGTLALLLMSILRECFPAVLHQWTIEILAHQNSFPVAK